MIKKLLRLLTTRFIRETFWLWELLGVHLTLRHFYSPIPHVAEIPGSIFENQSELLGINMNTSEQLKLLEIFKRKYKEEYDMFGLNAPTKTCSYYVHNGTFGEIDGDLLYSMVRHYKPKRLIEIGSGWSTRLASHALEKNGENYLIDCIEPFPRKWLEDGSIKHLTLHKKKVQDVDISLFQGLDENDILFIDSTHVAKIGSDVCTEFFAILPNLKKGVIVHIHDIFFPMEYPESWIKKHHIFWNEQYLLQAFLMYNDAFKVILGANWIKTKYPDICESTFRTSAAQSFWIQKIKD